MVEFPLVLLLATSYLEVPFLVHICNAKLPYKSMGNHFFSLPTNMDAQNSHIIFLSVQLKQCCMALKLKAL